MEAEGTPIWRLASRACSNWAGDMVSMSDASIVQAVINATYFQFHSGQKQHRRCQHVVPDSVW